MSDAEPAPRSRGTVYTFYSFKGGVGRSMALANTAALLAKWGRSVLVVDFDLEAPGIEKFFEKWTFGSRRSTPGLVDVFTSFARGDVLPWQSCLLKVSLPEAQPISILSAGREDADYGARLRAISWETLFEQQQFGAFLERLRQQWTAEYDFVLVDSRTGFTDIGGICTIHLPDVLLTLFTTTEQGLNGVKEVMEKSRKAHASLPVDRRRLLLVPVPARDESRTEYKLAAEWRARFASELGAFYDDWIPKDESAAAVLDLLKIPYVAFWSFGERLPVLEEDLNNPDKLAFFYQLLARLVMGKLDLREVRAGSLAGHASEEQKAEAAKRLHEAELARHKAQREAAEQEVMQREREAQARRERYERYLESQWWPAHRRYSVLWVTLMAIGLLSAIGIVTAIVYDSSVAAQDSAVMLVIGLGLMSCYLCAAMGNGYGRKAGQLRSLRAQFEAGSDDVPFPDQRFRSFVEDTEWTLGRNPLVVGVAPVNPFTRIDTARPAPAESAGRAYDSPVAVSSPGERRMPASTAPDDVPRPAAPSPVPPQQEEYDLFISCRREEFTLAWLSEFQPLFTSWLSDLLGRHVSIFLDQSIDAGEPMFERIEAVLERSRILLAIVTPSYLRSEHAMREVGAFTQRGGRIVPLLLRGPIEAVPHGMRTMQVADFREFAIVGEGFRKTSQYVEFQMQIRRLAEQLAEQLTSSPPPDLRIAAS